MKDKIDNRTKMNGQFITTDLLYWLENTGLRFGSLKGKAKKSCLILVAMLTVNGVIAQERNAIISFEKKKHDFGKIDIKKDSAVSVVFPFDNIESIPLVVYKVTTSCGCTASEWTKAPVEAGKKGQVKIVFNPQGFSGNLLFDLTNNSQKTNVNRLNDRLPDFKRSWECQNQR
ncbi:MAG: DUF1573 domain-containing protein [Prevotellaceae bacterium]|jgi:hypothetical protein|nr:DUF1573 domain-containing protein [Prevotellaceae bacterium]